MATNRQLIELQAVNVKLTGGKTNPCLPMTFSDGSSAIDIIGDIKRCIYAFEQLSEELQREIYKIKAAI